MTFAAAEHSAGSSCFSVVLVWLSMCGAASAGEEELLFAPSVTGVWHNEVDVLRRFAESHHVIKFVHDGTSFTYYDHRDQRDESGNLRLTNGETPIRVIASAASDSTDPWVKALALEAGATNAGERFVSVEVELLRNRRRNAAYADEGAKLRITPRCSPNRRVEVVGCTWIHRPSRLKALRFLSERSAPPEHETHC